MRLARCQVRLHDGRRPAGSGDRPASGLRNPDRRRSGASPPGDEMMNRKADFPIFANNPGLHYLDSAATSQKPRPVLDAVVDFYETCNANPHRGAYALSVEATDRYDAARKRVAKFVGLGDPD